MTLDNHTDRPPNKLSLELFHRIVATPRLQLEDQSEDQARVGLKGVDLLKLFKTLISKNVKA